MLRREANGSNCNLKISLLITRATRAVPIILYSHDAKVLLLVYEHFILSTRFSRLRFIDTNINYYCIYQDDFLLKRNERIVITTSKLVLELKNYILKTISYSIQCKELRNCCT